jgi:signal transduction histidine kinase/DNA-binding NarL/FixJ family response regulator
VIELGTIGLKGGRASVLTARRRIRSLALSLGVDTVQATRLAMIASETGRLLLRSADQPRISIALQQEGSETDLLLRFEGWSVAPDTTTLERFVDAVQIEAAAGETRVVASARLPAAATRLDDALLRELRERLHERSRDELMSEIQGQNTELERHRNQLEDLVEARTSELRDAQNLAEDANRAKSQFLSSMSHELRTPLNGVLGYTQLLQQDVGLSREQRDSLNAIENCGRHLLTLINDVLDLSKIEAGRLELRPAPCDLEKLLRSVFDIVRPRADAAGLAFELDIDPAMPRGVETDETKLKQVLLNLLGNSVKFTEAGRVVLRSSVRDQSLRFEVEDTGIGMTPDELAQVFDPFKQAEGGRRSGGTGLGLAISQRIVEALGGRLDVRSSKGSGTCFTAELPLLEVALGEVAAEDETSLSGVWNLRLAPGQDVSILVADDNDVNRDIMLRMLERVGFRTLEARDGVEALEQIAEHRPPLALLDIRMPRMGGIEAARELRARPETSKMHLVAVSADVLADREDEIAEAGFDSFVRKPVRAGDLFHCLARLLDAEFAVATPEPALAPAAAPDGEAPPTAITGDVLARIRDAAAIGDVSSLAEIAAELERTGGPTAAVGAELDRMARDFELDAIEKLVVDLEAAAGSRERG